MLPETLKNHLIRKMGNPITSAEQVSGGSINRAARIEIKQQSPFFLKWNTGRHAADMFEKEIRGLQLLREAGTELHIPNVEIYGKTPDGTGFILMEYVGKNSGDTASAEHFGRQLAHLHQQSRETFGLDHDNYIGRLPQSNRTHSSWVSFFVEERIHPQLKQAVDSGNLPASTRNKFQEISKKLLDIFPEEPPALLHGDLWGGNYFFDTNGIATLFDPAVYYGHREIELAFTHLFGGFSDTFYQAYNNAYPVKNGFSERKDLYNLYPLLVHTNMFGGHYGRQVQSIIKSYS